MLTIIKVVTFSTMVDYIPIEVLIADVTIFVMICILLILSATKLRHSIYYPWLMVFILSSISVLTVFNTIFNGNHPLDFTTMIVLYNILLINMIAGAFVVHTL